MTINKAALLAKVKQTGEDMTQATTFTEREPYPEGKHMARFVGYIELGRQKTKFQGKDKVEVQAHLLFELSGPKIKKNEDGTPNLFGFKLSKSLNEKSNFFKVFQRLNHAGTATHIAELLGNGYLIELFHNKKKGTDGKERVYVNMRKNGEPYAIEPPQFLNPMTGEVTVVPVDAPTVPEKLFLWDFADMEQWNSLFIDGEYPERKNEKGEVTAKAKSKNVFQNTIKLAVNFNGSPIHALLAANGQSLDIPDAEAGLGDEADDSVDETTKIAGQQPVATPTGAAADDALAGVV